MSLYMFAVIAEGSSDNRAFAEAQQNPAMVGRTRYEILDGGVLFPSDKIAFQAAESTFGVQPQESKVYIAGADTNTVWAHRLIPTKPGLKRLMFFGLQRR